MLARCSLAVSALAVCLVVSPLHAQEGAPAAANNSTGGELKLPNDLFGREGAVLNNDTRFQSGVSGYEAAPGYIDGGAPVSYGGGGSAYSPSLGGHLRARYNTQSYGQAAGNLDLGTMFLHQEDDRAYFFDGQVTMNDESHIGFNIGVGARVITDTEFSIGDDQKIVGLSLWADGSSTQNDNFFPQLGISYELLGETWDLRANASFVLENQTLLGEARPLGALTYFGNNIGAAATTGRDNAMHLTEIELARRLGSDRELWGFAGAYGLYGGDSVETAGYKLGFRGYATPDLALSIAVTDDDLFDTNTIFSVTWFIGRTRTNTQLNCDLRDRLREPVQRNDYVAVYQDSIDSSVGTLTFDLDGDGTSEDIRFVHVDSSAAAGGDGTFENPLNTLDGVDTTNSQENDVVLVHSGSTFAGHTGVTLQDGQRLLGEGGDMTFTINTDQFGVLTIPETATDAQAGAVPIVNTAAGSTAVTLADNNEVANLTLNGGTMAIASGAAGATGAGDPNLHDLTIDGTTGDGIFLRPFERVDGANTTIAFNATLSDITFSNVGGNDIDIDATSVSDPTLANVTLNETISISNITSSDGGDVSLLLANTHSGGTATINSYTYDGGTTGLGAMNFEMTNGAVNVTNSSATGGSAGSNAFAVNDNEGIVTFGVSNTVTDINGRAANITNNMAQVDFAATISNTTVAGGTVRVEDAGASVTVNGDITTLDVTSVEVEDALAAVTVSGNITRDGTAGTAVSVIDNVAGDGGSVLFSDTNAVITSNNGSVAVSIDGGDDDVTFNSDIMDTGGIRVMNRTGGAVAFAGDVTSNTGTNDAVSLTNIDGASVSFNGLLDIDTTTGQGFVADSGDVSVTNTDSTIDVAGATAGGGLVLDGTPGAPITSTGGVTFAEVNVGAGSTNGVLLDNVQGAVTVNGGVLNTIANAAVQVNNATSATFNDVEMNSGGADAVTASYDHDQANTLAITGSDFNSGNFTATNSSSTAAAGTTVTLSNITEAADFDYNATGNANLTATMGTVTGTGNTTLDVTNDGDASLTMTSVNLGGTVAANSSAGSTGNLTLNMTNSGNTTQFGAITINDQGNGNVNADLTNVDTNSTLDFDSDGNGSATLAVTGGSVGGAVTVDAANSGTFTTFLDGGGDYNSTVAINAANGGNANVFVTGNNTIDGAFSVTTSSNVDMATVSLDSEFNNTVTVTAENQEDFDFTMTGSQVTTGAGGVGFTLSMNNNVEAATVTMTNNTFDSAISITADNDQALDMRLNNQSVTTNSDDVAFELLVDSGPSDVDIIIQGSDFTTNDAAAFNFTNNSASASVDFHLDNNDFTNSSATNTATITNNAGFMNATVNGGNTFASNGGGTVAFEISNNASGDLDMLLQGNTATGGTFELIENAETFRLFELANVAADNTGTVNVDAGITDAPSEPTLPTP